MPDVGDIRIATLTVAPSGVDTDATLTVYKPDGTTVTPLVSGSGTGTLTAPVTYDMAYWWLLKWTVTGTGAGVEHEYVYVPPAPTIGILPVYASVEELREQFSDDQTLLLPEKLLQRALRATSRAVDKFTGRRFWQDATAVARTYRPEFRNRLDVDDISTTSGLIVEIDDGLDGTFSTTWTLGQHFVLRPSNAILDGKAYTRIETIGGNMFPCSDGRDTVRITVKWGLVPCPDDVNYATILRSAALFKRTDSPNGIAGFDGFGAVRISRQMDPDVADLLGPYCRVEALVH